MSDLHEQAEEHKRSDTSLMNFIQNHRVSVTYVGEQRRWKAKSADRMHEGWGNGIRLALIDLERKMKHERN